MGPIVVFQQTKSKSTCVTAITESGFGFAPNKLSTIPSDWYYTIQTLEKEINKELDEMHKKYPDDYFKRKRPDVFDEKK